MPSPSFSLFLLGIFPYVSSTERVLILQASTVDYNRQSWEKIPRLMAQRTLIELSEMDTYNYASFHGYHYVRYKSDAAINEHNAHGAWTKVFALDEFIHSTKYDWIVVLDMDIFFMQYEISLLDKLMLWDKASSDIYMPLDTNEPTSYMIPKGLTNSILNVNTGFQVWRVNKKNAKIIATWKGCLTDPDCGQRWLQKWPFEQGAFNYMIRPSLSPRTLFPIPCNEANGFDADTENFVMRGADKIQLGNHGCNGTYVSHLWEETKRYNHGRMKSLLMKKFIKQTLSRVKDSIISHP
jgi:hypothetical protein